MEKLESIRDILYTKNQKMNFDQELPTALQLYLPKQIDVLLYKNEKRPVSALLNYLLDSQFNLYLTGGVLLEVLKFTILKNSNGTGGGMISKDPKDIDILVVSNEEKLDKVLEDVKVEDDIYSIIEYAKEKLFGEKDSIRFKSESNYSKVFNLMTYGLAQHPVNSPSRNKQREESFLELIRNTLSDSDLTTDDVYKRYEFTYSILDDSTNIPRNIDLQVMTQSIFDLLEHRVC